MARAVLCSIGYGAHEELLGLARPTFERFAERYGYALDLRTELAAPERPPAWSKVRVMRDQLASYDVVMWIDAHAVVVDPREDLATTVSRWKPVAMVAHEYGGQRLPNSGVLALRRGRTSTNLLDAIWAKTEYVDHKWWENAALLDLLGYDVSTEPIVKVRRSQLDMRVRWLSQEWNSIEGSGSDAPIIQHFPGLSQADRLDRMQRLTASSRA